MTTRVRTTEPPARGWRKRLPRVRSEARRPERPQRVWSLLVSPSYFREQR
jgi:hypothetical protein